MAGVVREGRENEGVLGNWAGGEGSSSLVFLSSSLSLGSSYDIMTATATAAAAAAAAAAEESVGC